MRNQCSVLVGVTLAIASLSLAGEARAQFFQVTLTNLTNTAPNSGQPFSPPVFATHNASVHLWQTGQAASEGIQHIAEEGNRTFLVNALTPLVGTSVRDLVTPLSSPLPQGGTVTINITADAAHPFLSTAFMLGWTNDGFSGLDTLDLRSIVGTQTFDLIGMDAGTEVNNEQTGFLGALGGGNARAPENGVITVHPGILGFADAPTSWNWSNPVGRLTITAVAPEPGTVGLLTLGLIPLAGLVRRKSA